MIDLEAIRQAFPEHSIVLELCDEVERLQDQVEDFGHETRELKEAGRTFLDASNDAAKELPPHELRSVMVRWQNAGAKLRALTKPAVLVH